MAKSANVNAAVYDVLKLVNDDDTLLADANIPSGKLHQMRLSSALKTM
jgi:hypothetical protein